MHQKVGHKNLNLRNKRLSKRNASWVFLAILCITGIIFILNYFPQAHPIVKLNLTMNRQMALKAAQELAMEMKWGPEEFRQAASFNVDSNVQYYVELEAGGADAFCKLIADRLYSPYFWKVRYFKEGETKETLIRFTPDGTPYGFVQTLPENERGADLTPEAALTIAKTQGQKKWGIDFKDYMLIESARNIRTSGRVDHSFVYERQQVRLQQAALRLKMVVSRDTLTELTHYVQIPDTFFRRYKRMRSSNETLYSFFSKIKDIFYILGGLIISLFFLHRHRLLEWKMPLYWSLLIAGLVSIADISRWPIDSMYYNTALSLNMYWLKKVVGIVMNFVAFTMLNALIFMAAEGLTRQAFPKQIQLWKLWSGEPAATRAVFHRTIIGYLFSIPIFAYVILFYLLCLHLPGWWIPSSILSKPDIIATHFPWLSSIAKSLLAGFREECLYRAIPIAGAIVIGKYFGRPRTWMVTALIFQALVFAGSHAFYAHQPAYARLVELLIPALVFGLIYIYFGLLSAILVHFAYNAFWFAMPLFVSSSPGIWTDRALVILIFFIPLWIVLYHRVRQKKWRLLKRSHFNLAWRPVQIEKPANRSTVTSMPIEIKTSVWNLTLLSGVAGLLLWILIAPFTCDDPPLTFDSQSAIKIAQEAANEMGMESLQSWQTLTSTVSDTSREDLFIWLVRGRKEFRRLKSNYLAAPRWRIRFVRFHSDSDKNSEEYQVEIAGSGQIVKLWHQLPESRPGANLDETMARRLSDWAVNTRLAVDTEKLHIISSEETTLPERKDWRFVYEDASVNIEAGGKALITVLISGDKVAGFYKHVLIPENWQRQRQDKIQYKRLWTQLRVSGLHLLAIAGAFLALVTWSRRSFPIPVFIWSLVFLLGLETVNSLNKLPSILAVFTTSKPFAYQLFNRLGYDLLKAFKTTLATSLCIGFVVSRYTIKTKIIKLSFTKLCLCGLSVGCIYLTGLTALPQLFDSLMKPAKADHAVLNTFFPVIGIGLDSLLTFIYCVVFISLAVALANQLTSNWTRWKWPVTLSYFIIAIIAATPSVEHIEYILFSSITIGYLIVLTYQHIFSNHIKIVPFCVAIVFTLNAIQQAIFNPIKTVILGNIFSLLLIYSSLILFDRLLLRNWKER